MELAQLLLHREQQGSDPSDPSPQLQNKPSWCKCGYCREMPTEQERVCCKSRPCFTQQDGFYDIALNRQVGYYQLYLQMSIVVTDMCC